MVVADESEFRNFDIERVFACFLNGNVFSFESKLRIERILNEPRSFRAEDLHIEEMAFVLLRYDARNTEPQQGHLFRPLHGANYLGIRGPHFLLQELRHRSGEQRVEPQHEEIPDCHAGQRGNNNTGNLPFLRNRRNPPPGIIVFIHLANSLSLASTYPELLYQRNSCRVTLAGDAG